MPWARGPARTGIPAPAAAFVGWCASECGECVGPVAAAVGVCIAAIIASNCVGQIARMVLHNVAHPSDSMNEPIELFIGGR